MAGNPAGYGYSSGYGSYPTMNGNSAGCYGGSGYGSYLAMDGNSAGYYGSSGSGPSPATDTESAGNEYSSKYEHGFVPYVSNEADLNTLSSPTSSSWNPVHTTPSHRKYTQSASASTTLLRCLHHGCEYETKRQYDLDRHQKTHFPPEEKLDCTGRGCGRTGAYGFDRKDHLTEHLLKVHAIDIRKKPRKRAGWTCPENGCDRPSTYAFSSKVKLRDHLRLVHPNSSKITQ